MPDFRAEVQHFVTLGTHLGCVLYPQSNHDQAEKEGERTLGTMEPTKREEVGGDLRTFKNLTITFQMLG